MLRHNQSAAKIYSDAYFLTNRIEADKTTAAGLFVVVLVILDK